MINLTETDADFVAHVVRELITEYQEGEAAARKSCELLLQIVPDEDKDEARKETEQKFVEANEKMIKRMNEMNRILELMMVGSNEQ